MCILIILGAQKKGLHLMSKEPNFSENNIYEVYGEINDWCASHSCPTCGDCPHSHCFNCYQKGKAFWWMMAKIYGWGMELTGCGDSNSDGSINVSDAVYIINYVFIGGPPPDPIDVGDTNCDGDVNVSDAVWIINYVFLGDKNPCDTNGDGVPDC